MAPEELARRGREFEALRRLLPAVARRLPRRLSALYDFVPEQDLTGAAGRAAPVPAADARRLERALDRLPARHPGTPLARAAAALAAGRWAEAARRAAAAGGPRAALLEAAAHWCRADRERSRAPLPVALEAVERAVALGEDGREALLLRAQVRFEFEDNERGLADLDVLLARDPADRAARLGRAEVLGDLHRFDEAVEELEAVARSARGAWWVLAQRARVTGMAGRREESLADFGLAIARRPLGSLFAWRAEVLRGAGRYREARADADAAVRRDSLYAFAWETRGRLRLLAGDPAGARADCARAEGLDPALRLAALWRAEAALKLGRPAEAWAAFERAAPLDPATAWNPPAPEGAVPGRAARAAAFRADLAQAAGPWGELLRGRFAVEGGRPREALAPLTRAGRGPWAARGAALAWRGRALLALGGPVAAARELAAALALRPGDARARAWRGQALLACGREEEALAEWGRALRAPDPCLAAAYTARAEVLARRGARRAALADYTAALVCDARHEPARRGRDALERPA